MRRQSQLLAFVAVGVLIFGLYLADEAGLFGTDKALLPASIGRIVGTTQGHILVKFKDNTSDEFRQDILHRHQLSEQSVIGQLGVKLIKIPDTETPQSASDKLNNQEAGNIEFAEPDFIVEPSYMPDDPWFINWQKDKQQINLPGAWDSATGSAELTLAVVDTGVNCNHEDIIGKCVNGWNFFNSNSDTSDINGHGTSVAGVAAAIGNNALGVTGTAWLSKIMPLRVSAANGTATYSAIAAAITYAADNGAKVVNVSYQAGGSSTVRNAAKYLKDRGGLLVVSEGNYSSNTGYSNSPDLISVSAVDSSDVIYSWSSFGQDADISAPGCTGATTLLNGGYGSFCGTSNSAPEIAGVLLLIWSANPTLTPDVVQQVLFNSARDLGNAGWDQYYGWGRVDALAAVRLAIEGGISVSPTPTITPTPQPTSTPAPTPPGKAKKNPRPRP